MIISKFDSTDYLVLIYQECLGSEKKCCGWLWMFCCMVISSKIRVHLCETFLLATSLPVPILPHTHTSTHTPSHSHTFLPNNPFSRFSRQPKVFLLDEPILGLFLFPKQMSLTYPCVIIHEQLMHPTVWSRRARVPRSSIPGTVLHFTVYRRKKYLWISVWVIQPGRGLLTVTGKDEYLVLSMDMDLVLLMLPLEAHSAWFMCRVAESSMRISVARSWRTCTIVQTDTWSCPLRAACYSPLLYFFQAAIKQHNEGETRASKRKWNVFLKLSTRREWIKETI